VTARWLVCVGLVACRGAADEVPGDASAVDTASDPAVEQIVLDVARPDGAVEQIYAHVAVPTDDGPHPVVVYAHGQGLQATFNCALGPPDDAVSDHAARVAEGLAREGWLVVAPLFRNRGDTAPAIGALRPRDHHLLDASAVLAAARHGADHPAGSPVVGMVGMSMGSFAVTWAGADAPQLQSAAEGLDLRVAVVGGMVGDHLANLGRLGRNLDAEEELARAEAITQAGAGVLAQLSFPRGVDPIDGVDFVDDMLTSRGEELMERGLLSAADGATAACAPLEGPPICATDCFVELFYEVLDDAQLAPESFLADPALEALAHWDATAGADPGPDVSNELLATLRAKSPAYALPPARVDRFVTVIADGDTVVQELLALGDEPRQRWLSALGASGAELRSHQITEEGCGHDDYLLPGSGVCGYDVVADELHDALE